MTNSLTTFNFNDQTFRNIIDENGDPLFIASDVCNILDIPNVSQALSRLDDDEKGDIILNDTAGRPNRFLVVTEAGLYALIGGSRKPEAKAFRRYVNHEVLPSIRKTGIYAPQLTPAEIILMQAQKLVDLERKQAETDQRLTAIEANARKAGYFTVKEYCRQNGLPTQTSVMQKFGRDAKALSSLKGYEVERTPDPSYGYVFMYHRDILAVVCKIVPKDNPDQPKLLK